MENVILVQLMFDAIHSEVQARSENWAQNRREVFSFRFDTRKLC